MTTRTCCGLTQEDLLSHIDSELASGMKATLALVFCSPDWDVRSLMDALAERHLTVVGTTTAGEIAGDRVLEGGGSVMLWEAAPGSFEVWAESRSEGESMREVAQRLGQAATDWFARPVVLTFASGLTTDGEAVVRGVKAGAGRALPLYGGLAGDNLRMERTEVFTHSGIHEDGLVGLVLDGERYHVDGIATSGWKPVGIAKTVTRSEGNQVFELDGESVLDVYGKYLNMDGLRESNVSIAMDLGVQYPISVEREDGTSVIRAPLLSDPETDALIFAGAVPEGAKVRFCIPPSLDIVDHVVDEANTLHGKMSDADAVVLISCAARRTALGPIVEDEILGLDEIWRAPMAGYFSYGEIGGPTDGGCDFHNETCMLLVVRETPYGRD
ncbi:MAG: FIST N-terminal domain-containing protein [Bacteroidota bacterium]